MADKAIYSVDTVTSMSGTDKVYVNTGNNIKQITKNNLCGNDIDTLSGDIETLKTEVNNNTNAISEIKANITTNIYNLNDVVKGKWITDKNGSTGSSASWVYLPLNVKGLKTVTISALGGTASWNKHYFNDSNGTTIAYNNSQITASVPSDATILYVNIYEEFTDINAIKITTESVGEVVTDINDSLSVLGKCKNLLKTTLGSGNGNGITYINNGNGTYTLSGTCTNTFELHFNPSLKLPYGKYKLLGTSAYQKTNNGEWRATVSSGEVFEVSESKPVLDVMAYISSGSVVNQTIKPMVTTNLNATKNDFVPYTGDGDTLTADVAKIKNDMTWKRVARVTTTSTDDVISVLPDTWKEVMVDIEDTTTNSTDNCYARSVFTIYRECVTYNGNNYFRTGYSNLVVNITGNHSIKIPEMNSGTAVTIYYRN